MGESRVSLVRGLAKQYEKVRTKPGAALAISRLAKRYTRNGESVIDVGCGGGNHFALLRKLVGREGEVWAVEPNPVMFATARKAAKKFGVKLFKKKAEQVSSLGKKFDVIFASLSLQFCDAAKAVNSFKKSLKPGGVLLFVIPTKRTGISGADDRPSRRFMKVFHAGVRRRLKAKGLPAKFDFSYVYSRGPVFRRLLLKNGFRIVEWREAVAKKANLADMRNYYTIPWRSEKAMPNVKFKDRHSVIFSSLKEAFAEYPRFKVKRYYIACAARAFRKADKPTGFNKFL